MYNHHKDTKVRVFCECGEELEATSSIQMWCDNCGRSYKVLVTEYLHDRKRDMEEIKKKVYELDVSEYVKYKIMQLIQQEHGHTDCITICMNDIYNKKQGGVS